MTILTPQAGIHYNALATPQPVTSPRGTQIEVLEFFGYFSPHSHALEPFLENWRQKRSADVTVRRVPVVFGPHSVYISQQKLCYTLEIMGVLDAMHPKVYEAVHQQRISLSTDTMILDWALRQGLDQQRFQDVFNSFGVTTKVTRATQLQNSYRIDGVPNLAVDGRYMTSPSQVANAGKYDSESAILPDVLAVLDFLVDKVLPLANT